MADQDLNIKVTSTADLAALKQAESEIEKFAVQQAELKAKGGALGGAGAIAQPTGFAPELFKEAGAFGTGAAGYAGLTAKAAEAQRATEAFSLASLLAGTNVARLRNEFVTLTREFAAGAPISRTLGALIGALGFELIAVGAAVAGPILLMGKAFKEASEQANKITDGVAKQREELDKSATSWQEMAENATKLGDETKIVEQGAQALAKANEQNRAVQAEQLPLAAKLVETLNAMNSPIMAAVNLIRTGHIWQPFTEGLEAAKNEQAKFVEEMDATITRSITLARQAAIQWERINVQPTVQSYKELTGEIQAQVDYINKIDISAPGGLKELEMAEKKLETLQNGLKGLAAIAKERDELHTELFPSLDKNVERTKEVTENLQAMGIQTRDLNLAFGQAERMLGKAGEDARQMVLELQKLRNIQATGLARELERGPVDVAREFQERQKKHAEEVAARRELAAEGLGQEVSQAEERKFQQEEELKLLQRKQALQRSLLPPGEGFGGQEALKILGPEGVRAAQERDAAIKLLLQTVGRGGGDPTQGSGADILAVLRQMLVLWQ